MKHKSRPVEQLDVVIEGYLAYLTDVSRKAPLTVRDMRCTLKKISRQMAQDHPGVPLWKLSLQDYIHWLNHERALGRSGPNLCKYLSHVRGLLDYAWRSGRSDRNVLDGFALQDDQPRRPPEALSEEEAAQLIHACPARTAQQRRDRAMILVLYGCGLRTDELCQLRVEDVSREAPGTDRLARQGGPATGGAYPAGRVHRTAGLPGRSPGHAGPAVPLTQGAPGPGQGGV